MIIVLTLSRGCALSPRDFITHSVLDLLELKRKGEDEDEIFGIQSPVHQADPYKTFIRCELPESGS